MYYNFTFQLYLNKAKERENTHENQDGVRADIEIAHGPI